MKHKFSRLEVVGLTLAITLAVAGPVIAATLFTHNFPRTPNETPAVLATTCTDLTETASSTVSGTSGSVIYTCAGNAALNSAGGPVTPSFPALPTGALSLSFILHGATTCTDGTVLTSGTSVNFPVGDYDYCVAYTSYPGLGIGPFSIQWTQP